MVSRQQNRNKPESLRLRPLSACIKIAIAGGVLINAVPPVRAEMPVASDVFAVLNAASGNNQAPLPQALDAATAGVIDQIEGPNKLNVNLADKNRAILNWKSFNVNAGHEVQFHQKDNTSIALNRIFQADGSKILGTINANGQIYLYNQNGFVFGQNSVVNANTLVTTTLNISDEAFNGGITQQAAKGSPAFGQDQNGSPTTATKLNSAIDIKPGAQIHVASNTSKKGPDGKVVDGNDGLVIMAAPNIKNEGTISTGQYGQIILVASEGKVYLQPGDPNSPFHGFLVEVDVGGSVENIGNILAREGNITLEGFAVKQNGQLTATTSVNENGSIRLLAQEGAVADGLHNIYANGTTRGTAFKDGLGKSSAVTFGPNSVTQVIADASSPTAFDGQAQQQSYVEITGDKIDLQGSDSIRNGATITAPGGKIDIFAADGLGRFRSPTGELGNAVIDSTKPGGRVLIESGANIDVSGYKNVSVAMERNLADISVQSFDLRDSPLQKGGVLQGQTVRVDIRKANPIVNISGAVNRVARSVEERLGMFNPGQININSGGDVLVNAGSVINISGGSVEYQDGYLNTTKLINDYGQIVDISNADPNEHYMSIFGVVTEIHKKWGVTQTFNILDEISPGQFEKGYVEGHNAGTLTINTPLLSWNGELVAGTSNGRYQRATNKAASGGSFAINGIDPQSNGSNTFYTSSQDVVIQADKASLQFKLDDQFPSHNVNAGGANVKTTDTLVLSQELLNNSGLQNLAVKTDGAIKITEGTVIATPDRPGTSLTLDAKQIDVKGNVYLPSGAIGLSTHLPLEESGGKAIKEGTGLINLERTATLDVSGRWVNDFQKGFTADPVETLGIDGGTVSLSSVGALNLAKGSAIHADGGAWLALNTSLTAGKGGTINLAAHTDQTILNIKNPLQIDANLSAIGLADGGGLNVSSDKIIVGIPSRVDLSVKDGGLPSTVLAINNGQLAIAENGGFSDIKLTSTQGALTIKSNAHLNLLAQNRLLTDNFRTQASGRSIEGFSELTSLQDNLRHPVNLSLKGGAGVAMETGSSIVADKGATINLMASPNNLDGTGVFVDGLINAPGGNINVKVESFDHGSGQAYNSARPLWLGSHAQLLAQGIASLNPIDAFGRRSGQVLDGGTVTLTADSSYVVQRQGALVDVSGSRAILDLPVANTTWNAENTNWNASSGYAATQVGSNAGYISITAGEGVVLDGRMSAHAGTDTVRNGRLDVTLASIFNPNGNTSNSEAYPIVKQFIELSQFRQPILATSVHYGDKLDKLSGLLTGNVIPNDPNSLNGKAKISSQLLSEGGFDDVRLRNDDEIRFSGDVNLATRARLDINTPNITWKAATDSVATTGAVKLSASYLRIGTDTNFNVPNRPDLIRQSNLQQASTFTANAQRTELVGNTNWDGFNRIDLNNTHDLRLVGRAANSQLNSSTDGSLTTAANLNLAASQIYPTTLTNFTFTVDQSINPRGQVNISGNNTDNTPLSANGALSFHAPVIHQNGVLKAPFGNISLNASTSLSLGNGSLTSVSADGLTIPFGTTLAGLGWLYNKTVFNQLVTNVFSQQVFNPLQTKLISLNAPSISLGKGSVVNISGGGDLLAYEFQSGIGGTNDYLATDSPSYQGGFAILPGLGSTIAPSDLLQDSAVKSLPAALQNNFQVGSQVYLSGTGILPAGNYTILPPRYALLPGAFLVTPQANTQDMVIATHTVANLPVVSGYQTDLLTGSHSARTSGFLIEQGSDIRKHSQYDEQTANSFYTNLAIKNNTPLPLIPKDGGALQISAVDNLNLQGSINSAPYADGRGGKLDINASNIKVVENVSSGSSADGSLQLSAGDLSKLNVDSLLLGGLRNRDQITGQTDIVVNADKVNFESGAALKTKDLLVAAKTLVAVNNGATITATGKTNTGDSVLNLINGGGANGSNGVLNGDGAFLRVSTDHQVQVNRAGIAGTTGDLLIAKGAIINSDPQVALQSVLLDSTHSNILAGDLLMQGGSLSLNANTINIGEVSGLANTTALNLSNRQLSNLSVEELQLNSRGNLNVYGNVGQVDSTGSLTIGADGLLKPLHVGNLQINAAGIAGINNQGKNARIQADSLVLENLFAAKANGVGTGTGKLDFLTANYTQGNGDFAINGFNTVNFAIPHKDSTGQGFTVAGSGTLTVAADLNLTADYVTASGGSNMTFDATGHQVNFNRTGSSVELGVLPFGGRLNVVADSVNFNTVAVLPSGKLGLEALKGDVQIGANAVIDVAGRADAFGDVVQYTPGGSFSAVADLGNVQFSPTASVDLSTGGGGASGGNLELRAPKGTVDFAGQLKANAASAQIEVANYSQSFGNFDSLMAKLSSFGVSDSIYFRIHDDNIIQAAGNSINANAITLVSDNGSIDIAGTLNANGIKAGGSIQLYAGDHITLEDKSVLTATGAAGKGGKVLLSAVDSNNTDNINHNSGITLVPGSLFNVSGSGSNKDGTVTVRALREGTGVKVDGRATIRVNAFSDPFVVEAVKKYTDQDIPAGIIDSHVINDIIKTDTNNYMASATVFPGFLRPGVEIDSKAPLTLVDKWDFSDWRYNGGVTPGGLVIRSSKGITLGNSITDGFALSFDPNTGIPSDNLQTGKSWSYQITAGADLSSADTGATTTASGHDIKTGAKDLVIGVFNPEQIILNEFQDVFVRTGTGDINLRAAGDIVLKEQHATVYSTGRADATNRYGSLPPVDGIAPTEYPIDGGDITLKAGHDVVGAVSQQFFRFADGSFDPNNISGPLPADNYHLSLSDGANWLIKTGDFGNSIDNSGTKSFKTNQTSWGILFGEYVPTGPEVFLSDGTDTGTTYFDFNTLNYRQNFLQNIGSFGGGDVTIDSARNITNLSVMMPTTGKQLGNPGENFGIVNPSGNLQVMAGGDIAGGVYYVGQGEASITAGGAIKGGDQYTLGPLMLMGDTNITLSAGQGVSLTNVLDPMVLPVTGFAGSESEPGSFFSYTGASGISIKSLSGDVNLGTDIKTIDSIIFPATKNTLTDNLGSTAFKYYPASLQATAFGGSIGLDDNINLFPATMTHLNLLAKDNIARHLTDTTALSNPALNNIRVYDTELALLPTAATAKTSGDFSGLIDLIKPPPILRGADQEPARIITQDGDINGLDIHLAKHSIVQAGRDLSNVKLEIQNINAEDSSIISAGRDISFNATLLASGTLNPTDALNGIKVEGPGDVLVKSGRDINLGLSTGIRTIGNEVNANLDSTSARLTILVGLKTGAPDYSGFIDYLSKPENAQKFVQYQSDLSQVKALVTGFMRDRTGDSSLSEDAALAAFRVLNNNQTLPIQAQLNVILNKVFFSELKLAGSSSAKEASLEAKARGNVGGFAAADALFPGSQWQGDLNMVFSTIQTENGGDINLLVPGGGVNVGLSTNLTELGINKTESDLGIIALDKNIGTGTPGSNINAFIRDDFKVNQSRVFTQGGGDVLIWSSQGNIDAGKGAKSSLAVPEVNEIYKDGKKQTVITPSVSGSGIRAATTQDGVQGNAALFAPRGVVDAGEAGIGAKNVTISATAVLGANNIQIGGVGTGVPVAAGSIAAGLTGASNTGASVSQAAQTAASLPEDSENNASKVAAPSILTVDVIGFGT